MTQGVTLNMTPAATKIHVRTNRRAERISAIMTASMRDA